MSEQAAPLDWAYLAAATGGDASLEAEVLALFLSQAAQYIEALAAHIADDDWSAHAHKLKGAARSIGARPLAAAAAGAEQALKGERGERLASLRSEFARVEKIVSERLSKNLP